MKSIDSIFKKWLPIASKAESNREICSSNLIIEHLPFHGCFGRIDEIKRPKLETEVYSIES